MLQNLSCYINLSVSGGRMDDKQNSNSFESADDFEARIFRDTPEGNPKRDAFFTILDRLEKTGDGYASNQPGENQGGSHVLDGLDESFNTLSDGMDKKLKRAATDFQYDLEECKTDGYIFRPDANYFDGGTYEPKVCKRATFLIVYTVCSSAIALLLLVVLVSRVIS